MIRIIASAIVAGMLMIGAAGLLHVSQDTSSCVGLTAPGISPGGTVTAAGSPVAAPTAQVRSASWQGCARQVKDGVVAGVGDIGGRVVQQLMGRTTGYLSEQASALSNALGAPPMRVDLGGNDVAASAKSGSPSTVLTYKPHQGVEATRLVNF